MACGCRLKRKGSETTGKLQLTHAAGHDTFSFLTPFTLLLCIVLLQIQGSITYNGETFDQFVPQRTSAYIPQVCAAYRCSPILTADIARKLCPLL